MNLVKNILQYLNKSATKDQAEDFNHWLNESDENSRLLDEYATIWSESDQLDSFKEFDVEQEWALFSQKISNQEKKAAASVAAEKEKKPAKRIFLRRLLELSVAAVLACLVFYFVRPKPTPEVAPKWYKADTQDFKDTIDMIDGSRIFLAENSSIIYPAILEGKDKRTVYLKGEALFDVSPNDSLEFGVESYEVGIDVLGTIFKMNGQKESAEVENLEGTVNFFELENPENSKILNKGDRIKYEGGSFINLREIPGKDYRIDFVFEHLQSRYFSKISSASNLRGAYQANGKVRVDLTQNLEGILSQLDSTALFKAVPTRRCTGCYEITQFKALPRED